MTDEIQALEQPDNGIVIKGCVSDEELERLFASCRVVVVPLRYGAGVKGKVLKPSTTGRLLLPPPSEQREFPLWTRL